MNRCKNFINTLAGLYKPLSCKEITVQTPQLKQTGYANKQELFFISKAGTIHVGDLDLLLPTPLWYRNDVLIPPIQVTGNRITSTGATRVTNDGSIRVTS